MICLVLQVGGGFSLTDLLLGGGLGRLFWLYVRTQVQAISVNKMKNGATANT